ncbi:hypothetical protein DL1_12005 [Thioclava dalianensis]|uniref:Uncharacterized protein n=1 Tax=Thioclava dalianensis TaxID=1185766 RepID=A0A074T9E3_9RHOB|nr:hypothetical protein [Thioclava dalianensis]KEP68421.1 hypothetical protein DL1_12005 [Thioclava dalianensis]SFN62989.1 hypothetical protein SAMN05216224_10863 [Thioclava dalianensis]
MKINLTPFSPPPQLYVPLSLSVAGDVLTLNGKTLDLSGIPEGATLPAEAVASDWVTGPITRTNGELSLTLRLPHGPNAPEESRFPAPITVTEDGTVDLPPYDAEPEEAPE